jgi:hypothetical protein
VVRLRFSGFLIIAVLDTSDSCEIRRKLNVTNCVNGNSFSPHPTGHQAEFNHDVVVDIVNVCSTDDEDSAKTSLEHLFERLKCEQSQRELVLPALALYSLQPG